MSGTIRGQVWSLIEHRWKSGSLFPEPLGADSLGYRQGDRAPEISHEQAILHRQVSRLPAISRRCLARHRAVLKWESVGQNEAPGTGFGRSREIRGSYSIWLQKDILGRCYSSQPKALKHFYYLLRWSQNWQLRICYFPERSIKIVVLLRRVCRVHGTWSFKFFRL